MGSSCHTTANNSVMTDKNDTGSHMGDTECGMGIEHFQQVISITQLFGLPTCQPF